MALLPTVSRSGPTEDVILLPNQSSHDRGLEIFEPPRIPLNPSIRPDGWPKVMATENLKTTRCPFYIPKAIQFCWTGQQDRPDPPKHNGKVTPRKLGTTPRSIVVNESGRQIWVHHAQMTSRPGCCATQKQPSALKALVKSVMLRVPKIRTFKQDMVTTPHDGC